MRHPLNRKNLLASDLPTGGARRGALYCVMTRAAVLLNCGSQSKRAARKRDHLQKILRSSRLQADLLCAEGGAELAALARRAAESAHYDLLVAAGGDGTVNAVASAVAGTNKTLGVLPLGTVNHFAKCLGMPLDLGRAVKSLEDTETSLLDVGDVNGRLFVNNSTLGVYPRIIRFREHLRTTKDLNKWAAFAYAAARMIPRHEPVKLRLTVDGSRTISAATPFVFIGRSDAKLGSLNLLRGEKPGEGELRVFIVHARRGLSLLRLASRALAGKLSGSDAVETFRAKELFIELEGDPRRLHIAMDGEIVPVRSPIHYQVRRRALRVAAPKRTTEAARAPEDLALQAGG
jgi:diacylglycerol kinase family enzyme